MNDLSVKQLINQHRLGVEEGRETATAEDKTYWSNLRGGARAELVGRGLTALAECLAWESLFTRAAGLGRDERRARRMHDLVVILAKEIDSYTGRTFSDLVEAAPQLRVIWNSVTGERLRTARSRYLIQGQTKTVIDSAMWDALSPWSVDMLTTEDPPDALAVARLITEGVLDWSTLAAFRVDGVKDPYGAAPFVVAGEKVVLTALGRRIVNEHRTRLERKSL